MSRAGRKPWILWRGTRGFRLNHGLITRSAFLWVRLPSFARQRLFLVPHVEGVCLLSIGPIPMRTLVHRRRLWEFQHRRRAPLAGEGFRSRTIETHGQVERRLRSRKPDGFLVRPRALVLEVDVQRAIRIGFERHPACDGEPVQVRRLPSKRSFEASYRWPGAISLYSVRPTLPSPAASRWSLF